MLKQIDTQIVENEPVEQGMEPKNISDVAPVVPHVVFNEGTIHHVLDLLNEISIKGVDNISKFSEVHRILSTEGERVNITFQ